MEQLWAPWRLEYIKSADDDTGCIFCSLSGGNRDLADSISIAIDRGGSAGLVWTDQGRVLRGPTHITYGCNTSQQSAYAGANSGLSCKGPANR